MGLGLGILIKTAAPLGLYLGGVGSALLAAFGGVRWAFLLAVFLLPLRNVIERIQHFPGGNQFIDILLGGVILGGLINRRAQGPKDSCGIGPVAIAMVVFLLISLLYGGMYLTGQISFDIHDNRVQDWKNFSLMPLMFFLTFYNTVNKKEVWSTFALMCFAIWVVAFYTTRQISWHPSLVSRDQIHGTFQFLGPNEVAAFLNEYIIIVISVLYVAQKRYKWMLSLLVWSSLYCITFLYSRGAYIGLLAGLLILFSFKDKKMLLPLVLIVVLWQTVLPQNVIDRIKQTETDTGELDPSAQGRLDMWRIGMNLFKSNPVMGVGFGSFRRMGFELKDTHNIYVKILTEQGIIGMAIFILIVLCFLKAGWRLYRKGDDEVSRALGLGFFCCVWVMLVNNIFGNRWSYLEPNAYLWIFAGLVCRLNVISSRSPVGLGPAYPRPAREKPPETPAARLPSGPQELHLTNLGKKIRYYDRTGEIY